MQVESLLTGPFEPTNEAYATAKVAGIKLCQAYRQQYGANFIVGIPANLFGPGDDFSPDETLINVRMDHTGSFMGCASIQDCPGYYFV